MSAVGHCGDNAACEGFLRALKRESVYQRNHRALEIVKADLFSYIERFHNPQMRRALAKSDLAFLAVPENGVEPLQKGKGPPFNDEQQPFTRGRP